MQQTCKECGVEFEITEDDLKYYDTVSPVFGDVKFPFPPPVLCPEDRRRHRLAFRNLRYLHRRECDISGKQIITPYSPESRHLVYHSDDWWGDRWDSLQYGVDFDFSRPFFEQFYALFKRVPMLHHYVVVSENCDYINGAGNCRNCYLCFDLDHCENCYYLTSGNFSESCVDVYAVTKCELCYECVDCDNCYNLQYSIRCAGCSDSYFLSDCRQCKNCIGCSNLVNKEYYIFNKPCTPEEFAALKETLGDRAAVTELQARAQAHHAQFPKKYYYGHANEDFSGDNIRNARNSHDCYEVLEIENCKHCYYVYNANNCMDYSVFGENSEWMYECQASGYNCSNDSFCLYCWNGSSNNLYCHLLSASSNCFGCTCLKQKRYCVFNKQYTKDEYEQLVPKIIEHMQNTGEWGRFFPPSFAPFPLHETIGYELSPLTADEARARGYHWSDKKEKESAPATAQAPESIDNTPGEFTKELLVCAQCDANYRVIPQELVFYRKNNIPIPHDCPECRNTRRINSRPPRRLVDRHCEKCAAMVKTTHSLDRPAIIYCEECYLAEVY